MTNDDSSDDYELEPIDPEVIKHQQDRAQQKTREAEDTIDINDVYDEEEIGDPIDLEQLKQFRFTTRHLLIVTALLAMVMTLHIRLGGCMGLFVSGSIALGAGWWFVMREERRRLEKIEASRERYQERLAARRAVEEAEIDAENFARINADWEEENEDKPAFRFSFSMKEVLITFAIAAVILGCAQILGFQNAAVLIGFVALAGLLVQAFGVELPPLIVLGWWLLLVLYILISLWSTFGSPDPA